jgi:Arc/MetJ family transcription regulator
VRTNIEIDDKLMRRAMKAGKFRTKRETVEEALKLLVRRKQQAQFLDLAGKVRWEGDLDAWRRD